MGQFLNSVIRQLGRDTGKVLSNSIFGDAHSTPIRMVKGASNNNVEGRRVKNKSDFEKALNFDRSATPKLLVRKVQNIGIILEDEMSRHLSDEYLSPEEAIDAFKMLKEFASKSQSVAKQLEIDEETNANEIQILEKVVQHTSEDFSRLLKMGAKGCDEMAISLESKVKEEFTFQFFRWLLLNSFYMRGYARTGQKNLQSTILSNLLLPGTQLIMFFVGLTTAPFEIYRLQKLRKEYLNSAAKERERAKNYSEIAN